MKIALIAMLILAALQLIASLPLTAFSMGNHPQTMAYARAWHRRMIEHMPFKNSSTA